GQPAVAALLPSVPVPAGATRASFQVSTAPVPSDTLVTLKASIGGVTQSAEVTVQPLLLSSLTLSDTSICGGTPVTGTVTLSCVAPPGGTTVSLSSNDAAAVVPATVLVPSGQTS